MNKSTEKLVAALEAENNPRLKKLIKRAKREEFHDFESPHALPELILHEELIAYGFPHLAARVRKGDFDATPEESKNWANSLDGMTTFDDPQAIEGVKELAKALSEAQGKAWDEDEWNSFIAKHKIDGSVNEG